jgi:hypothetical protein
MINNDNSLEIKNLFEHQVRNLTKRTISDNHQKSIGIKLKKTFKQTNLNEFKTKKSGGIISNPSHKLRLQGHFKTLSQGSSEDYEYDEEVEDLKNYGTSM